MKKRTKGIALAVLAAVLIASAVLACAEIAPYGYQAPVQRGQRAQISWDDLVLRTGPGTGRYFASAGTYRNVKGQYATLLAYSYDPNNGIYWVKVEWPKGTGHTGWTGAKRFYASTFNMYDLPYESFYPGY